MIIGVLLGLVLAAILATRLIPHWRAYRADRRQRPEWWAEWKRADAARKRRIRAALRRGEQLADHGDARLLVGLGQWVDRIDSTGRRGWLLELLLMVVLIVAAALSGSTRLVTQAIVLLAIIAVNRGLALPRLRRRRRQALAANRRIASQP